jgi:2,5-diamino-6-(ribosylamino)-4(3H)-pyrimidinone 5'-phosphate reductase
MNQLENICNFVEISDWLSTAGQPTAEEFATIASEGFTKVINLALSTSTNAIDNEAEIAIAHGMEYVHIPVAWESPTIRDFKQFAEILNHSFEDKIFIHCALNMRVSVFVYLYRRIYQSIDHAVVVKDLLEIWKPNPIWQGFMRNIIGSYPYQPKFPHIYTFEELAFPTIGIEFEHQAQTLTRPYIVFNMVASVDGKTTTSQGQIEGLGSKMDRQIMNRLRSQVDAVVIGAKTFRADPFIPTVKSELLSERLQHFADQPLGIVVSNSGNLPLEHRFWEVGKDFRLVFLGAEASLEVEKILKEKAQVFRLSPDGNLAEMLNLLWQKFGVKTLMVEGGASLNYEFISAGWGDELFLTVCPKLVGGVKNSTIISGEDYGLQEFPDLSLRSLYQHENELYLRYQIKSTRSKLGGGVA